MHVGIAGEVRCVVTKADGKVKIDTGFQKNLILNQGLDFFGGGKGSTINDSCAIGSGNGAPASNQTKLDSFLALTSSTDKTSDYSYVDRGDNLYRMWEQQKYRFTGLDNVNISEVGLVSTGTTSENYYLTTRALIKDSLGAPTSISVKTGETLDIYYKIHKVIDISDKAFVVNVLDGAGGAVPHNIVVRPALVGSSTYNSVGSSLAFSNRNDQFLNVTDEDLVDFRTHPASKEAINMSDLIVTGSSYVSGTFKKNINFVLSLNFGNKQPLRVFTYASYKTWGVPSTFMPFQVRFGRVSDDAPITKTDKDTLTIPLEFRWGRYEGEL